MAAWIERMMTMTEAVTVQKISQEDARRLLNSCDGTGGRYEPLGLFYLEEREKFVGIDNSTGDAWTEEFPDKESCLRWLSREE